MSHENNGAFAPDDIDVPVSKPTTASDTSGPGNGGDAEEDLDQEDDEDGEDDEDEG